MERTLCEPTASFTPPASGLRGIWERNIAAIRSKQASVSCLRLQTGPGPTHHLGADDLVVPVSALDQPDGYLSTRTFRPVDQSFGVGGAAAEAGLHRQAGWEGKSLAASFEQLDGHVLEFVLLHVEVDEDIILGSGLEDRGSTPRSIAGSTPCCPRA